MKEEPTTMIDFDKLWASLTAALVPGIGWLIRRVLTNEKQIALLERDLQRGREDIKEMKNDIKQLLERKR